MAEVDARGLRCPWPVLRLARAMRKGGPVRIMADDPQAAGEITALAAERGWSLTPLPAEQGCAFEVSDQAAA